MESQWTSRVGRPYNGDWWCTSKAVILWIALLCFFFMFARVAPLQQRSWSRSSLITFMFLPYSQTRTGLLGNPLHRIVNDSLCSMLCERHRIKEQCFVASERWEGTNATEAPWSSTFSTRSRINKRGHTWHLSLGGSSDFPAMMWITSVPHPTLLDESPGWDPYELVRANKRVVLGRLGITLQTTVWGERAGRTSRCTRQATVWAGRMWTPLPPAVGFPLPSLWLVCSPLRGFSPPLPVVGFALPFSGCLSALSSCGWSFAPTPSSPVVGFSPPCFHIRCLCQKHSCSCGRLFLPKEEEKETENEKRNRERRKRKMDRKRQKKQEWQKEKEKRERRRSREKR